jgi:hypothetical protein
MDYKNPQRRCCMGVVYTAPFSVSRINPYVLLFFGCFLQPLGVGAAVGPLSGALAGKLR